VGRWQVGGWVSGWLWVGGLCDVVWCGVAWSGGGWGRGGVIFASESSAGATLCIVPCHGCRMGCAVVRACDACMVVQKVKCVLL
jgi:hypothetical protein